MTAFEVTESSGGGVALSGRSYGDDNGEPSAIGVFGDSDLGTGVSGNSKSYTGVEGQSVSGVGVWGHSQVARGVVGHSVSLDGVQGQSDQGTGVFGEGPQYGVHGKSNVGSAVYGEQTEAGDGVTGRSANGTGVAGVSTFGNGVYGRCDNPATGVPGAFGVGYAGYFEGSVQVTGDICLGNADCAEDFDVVDVTSAEPGTVMVLDESGRVRASDHAYDSCVAGVVSGAGGLRPGIILDRGGAAPDRRPLALIGKVYCKVDAGYGPIVVGDLLTTSATPGHAMRVSDRNQALGAVIGKALRAHPQGVGLIPVLVGLR